MVRVLYLDSRGFAINLGQRRLSSFQGYLDTLKASHIEMGQEESEGLILWPFLERELCQILNFKSFFQFKKPFNISENNCGIG